MASAGARAGRSFFQSQSSRQAFKILAWVPVGIFFTRHVYSVATITGSSMQPTFNPDIQINPYHNDVVLLEKWSVVASHFQRGDVVTLWSPNDPNLLTTKRIVALAGDIVVPLSPSPPTPVRIPEGHCWVEGDSNYHTKDSNTYGPVPLALINAKVTRIVWPRPRMGPVDPDTGKAKGRVRKHGTLDSLSVPVHQH